jgi:hypothetical protein
MEAIKQDAANVTRNPASGISRVRFIGDGVEA